MDIQLFKKIIQELSELEYSGRLGMFSNNEPFLDSRIEDLTKYAREKLPNAVIYLYTNGTVLTKKRYEAIIPYLTYMIIDNYNDYGNMNDKIKIINDLCEKNEYYKSKTKIVMRKQNEVLFSRGGNAPNKKNSTTLDMSCILPFKQIVIRPDGKLSLCNNDERQPIKFCVNNNPSSNNRTLDCGAIRLSDLPRVNYSFLSAECYARRA